MSSIIKEWKKSIKQRIKIDPNFEAQWRLEFYPEDHYNLSLAERSVANQILREALAEKEAEMTAPQTPTTPEVGSENYPTKQDEPYIAQVSEYESLEVDRSLGIISQATTDILWDRAEEKTPRDGSAAHAFAKLVQEFVESMPPKKVPPPPPKTVDLTKPLILVKNGVEYAATLIGTNFKGDRNIGVQISTEEGDEFWQVSERKMWREVSAPEHRVSLHLKNVEPKPFKHAELLKKWADNPSIRIKRLTSDTGEWVELSSKALRLGVSPGLNPYATYAEILPGDALFDKDPQN